MSAELSGPARALLDAARQQGGPSQRQRARLTAAVLATSATTAAVATQASSLAPAPLTVGTTASIAKLLGAGLLATLVGISATVAVKKTLAPTPRPVVERLAPPPVATAVVPSSPEPATVEAPPAQDLPATPAGLLAAPSVEPIVEPAPRAPPITPAPGATAPAPAPDVAVAESPLPAPPPPPLEPSTPAIAPPPVLDADTEAQATALRLALDALDELRPFDALYHARTTRNAHPRGAMRLELLLVEIDALCALDRELEARELAARIPANERTQPIRNKLRRSCVGP